jgi:hypothetical protein
MEANYLDYEYLYIFYSDIPDLAEDIKRRRMGVEQAYD